MSENLTRADQFHLQSADGWLGLGSPEEAFNELEQIGEEHRLNPDVLKMYWMTYAHWNKWSLAYEIAEKLVQLEADCPFGWIHRAYAMRRMKGGGLQAAWDKLLPAAKRFPNDSLIPYNLACYCSQLGQLSEAREWLEKAMRTGNRRALRKMALEDPDLEPLRSVGYLK